MVSTLLLSLIAGGPVDDAYFETHIRPLLIEHCLECHTAGGEDLGGNLALDSAAGWKGGGDSGPAVVPGDPDASVLIDAVRYDTLEMPPAGRLDDADVRVLEEWVRGGAPDPRAGDAATAPRAVDVEAGRDFWSVRPVRRHEPPPVTDQGWSQTGIDAFIAAGLEQAGIRLPDEAEPPARLRRLHFDLTGLPPSPEDVRRFLADPSPEAWQAEVDRLLDSPGFGEHWGRHWLDVARYADSNGSDFNAVFADAWRYRDYVVDSFNADRPFDEFIRQQIAGDLLLSDSDADRETGLVATGFLAIGAKMLSERDKEKLRMDVVDEQVDTLGRAFLGLTLGCARCHDHKFDPVPTHDYYALAGILRSTQTVQGEIQQYVSDFVRRPLPADPQHAADVQAHEERRAELSAAVKRAEKSLRQFETHSGRDAFLEPAVVVDTADARFTGQWKPSTHSPERVGDDYRHNDRRDIGTATFAAEITQPGRYEVFVAYSAGGSRETSVPVSVRHAGGVERLRLDQSRRPQTLGLFESLGTFEFEGQASVELSTGGTSGHVIADAVAFLPEGSRPTPPDTYEADLASLRSAMADAKKALSAHEEAAPPPLPMALCVQDVETPGDCTLRIRGESHREGRPVPRGFLQVVAMSTPAEMPSAESGRRELADWIASPENPLTARVAVNRVWQHLFGEGLVRSVDNFGRLGERPSHPRLLDWLAAEFVADGWSVKRLVRRIVLSRAYVSAANHDAAAAAADSDNRLLWRSHRRPLSAEQLRDGMLAIAGRLDRSRPARPMRGLGKLVQNNSPTAKSAARADLGPVRTLYRPVVRNELDLALTAFDFADPEVSVGRRPTTNVPSQALYLLNSELTRETAAAVAALATSADDPVENLFVRVIARPPTAAEREQVAAFVASYPAAEAGLEATCHALLCSTRFRILE